ncbi:MAG: hypothetical protein K9N06_04570 [Candidatus Cloacimonetes bacterium]|nr:hypothetical protein [Candidatus Cloacimonadota bacterium]
MKKNNNVPAKPVNNTMISTIIAAFFDIVRHFITDFDNKQKVKKIDKYKEGLQNIEHLIVRLEDKIEHNRKELEDLKNRLLWGNIIIIVLLLIMLYHLVS